MQQILCKCSEDGYFVKLHKLQEKSFAFLQRLLLLRRFLATGAFLCTVTMLCWDRKFSVTWYMWSATSTWIRLRL